MLFENAFLRLVFEEQLERFARKRSELDLLAIAIRRKRPMASERIMMKKMMIPDRINGRKGGAPGRHLKLDKVCAMVDGTREPLSN